MKLNLIETTSKKGEITVKRRQWLKGQIALLEEQKKELGEKLPDDLKEFVASVSLMTIIQIHLNELNTELYNFYDKQDEYNS